MRRAWLVQYSWSKGGTLSSRAEVVVVAEFEEVAGIMRRLEPPKHYSTFEPVIASVERLPNAVGVPDPGGSLKNAVVAIGSMAHVPLEIAANADAVIRLTDSGAAIVEKWRHGPANWELRTFGDRPAPRPVIEYRQQDPPPRRPRVMDMSGQGELTMDSLQVAVSDFSTNFHGAPETVRITHQQAFGLMQEGLTLFGLKVEIVPGEFDDDTRLLHYFGDLYEAAQEVVGVPMNSEAIDRLGEALILPPDIEAAVEGPRGQRTGD